MNQTIFEGIRGDNKNFIVLLYDFDLCQNSAHVKLHSSKAEQCTEVKKGEINYSEILLFQPSLGYF